MNNRKSMKKSWLLATIPPIKNPTAKELWNLRMIIVPPILRTQSNKALQTEAKHSAKGRRPWIVSEAIANAAVSAKIEYLSTTERFELNKLHDTKAQRKKLLTTIQQSIYATSPRSTGWPCRLYIVKAYYLIS